MIKLLATDLDGTLFYPKRKITLLTRKNKRFLRKFISDGNKVVLVTGRNENVSNKVSKILNKNLSLVGCNGSILIEDNKLVREKFIDHETAKKLYFSKKDDKKILIWIFFTSGGKMYLQQENCNFWYKVGVWIGTHTQFAYKEKYIVGTKAIMGMLENNDEHILKIMPCYGIRKRCREIALDATRELDSKFGDSLEVAWSDTAVEIMPKGTTKASSLRELVDDLGYTNDEVAVVGDSGNDVSLFKEFHKNSFVMKHAHNEVKKEAMHIIDSVSDIEKYLG